MRGNFGLFCSFSPKHGYISHNSKAVEVSTHRLSSTSLPGPLIFPKRRDLGNKVGLSFASLRERARQSVLLLVHWTDPAKNEAKQ